MQRLAPAARARALAWVHDIGEDIRNETAHGKSSKQTEDRRCMSCAGLLLLLLLLLNPNQIIRQSSHGPAQIRLFGIATGAVVTSCLLMQTGSSDDANAVSDVERVIVLREANVGLLLP